MKSDGGSGVGRLSAAGTFERKEGRLSCDRLFSK